MKTRQLLASLVVVGALLAAAVIVVTTAGLVRAEKLGHPRPAPGQAYGLTVQGTRLFLTEHDGQFFAFVDDANHMAGERFWWCPAERVFVAPTHGELFAADGSYIAGPASRGLDRVPVSEYSDGSLLIAGFVEEGRPRDGERAQTLDPLVRAVAEGGGWGENGFCAGNVSSAG